MTVADALRAFARQWLILLIGLLLTSAAVVLAGRTSTVYWSQTTVRFIGPPASQRGVEANSLVSSSESLVALAGLTLLDLQLPRGPAVAGMGPSIVDVGIYDGVWVRLPNSGGQWSMSFADAFLDVQVAGGDPEAVRRATARTVRDIDAALARRQDSPSIPTSARVKTQAVPPTPTVAVAHAPRPKPMAATLALGLGLTIGLALHADYRYRRRAFRRRSAPRQ